VLGYFLLRRLMPNATFYTAMVANSKLLVACNSEYGTSTVL
jgi:hypothetical protein